MQIKTNRFVNDIVDIFGCVVDFGLATTKLSTATNIDIGPRVLSNEMKGNEMKFE